MTTNESDSNFSDINRDNKNFQIMAEKSVRIGRLAYTFKSLAKDDVVKIFEMCL